MPMPSGEYKIFEDFIRRLFQAYDIPLSAEVELAGRFRADFVLTLPTGLRIVVETKLYGSTRAETMRLRQALAQVTSFSQGGGADGALLIVSIRLTADQRNEKRSRLDEALIFDLVDILYWSLISEDLFEEYYSFMLAIAFDSESSQSEIRRAAKEAKRRVSTRHQPTRERLLALLNSTATLNAVDAATPEIGEGSRLCMTLRELDPGRPDASAFELIAIDIIKYLFGRNLSRLEPQNVLDNGLRIDLCAKILPKDFFWKDLVRDFNCRYIVFEFKNYAGKISQEQVYSTEKYLLRDALRTIAIVISREGPDEGAKSASKGALREAGKVIVHLDLNDICQMLKEKDGGGTPEEILEQRLDEMLMSLAR
jgi:hypothetical protein